jgi:predicted acylesterase/phospholipase RssA
MKHMTTATYLSPPEQYEGVQRSLVIAGGGMRVAYQAGAFRALQEAGICFSHADGTSGGTINLAMLLSGLSADDMCQRWRSLDVKDFVSLMPLQQYLKAQDMLAMGDADGIIGKVFPHLGIDIQKINAASGTQGTFNVCNFTNKTNEAVPHDKLSLALLIAGISLPVFMPPVEVNDQLYTDSVWIKDANLMAAVKRGAEELWLIWCIGNTPTYQTGVFNQYVHMIELSANGGLFEEFEHISEINKGIAAGYSPYGQTSPIKLHIIKPRFPLPLDPDLYLGKIDTATLISMGYSDARAYLANINNDGLPFSPWVTKMQECKSVGIAFRETMKGAFSLHSTTPEEGAMLGRMEGTELSLHGAINVRDLEKFMADPEHLGELHGSIDFPPFGEGIPAFIGRFNLFSAAEDPQLKLMIYELAFEHKGQAYYLAGQKRVKDDPGFDLWHDTTTLYTTLHKGKDSQAPVVGAGILSLGIKELVKLVTTMSVSNAANSKEKLLTYSRFGGFFMGELWNSYASFVSNKED